MAEDLLDVALCAQTLFWVFVEDLEDEVLSLWGKLDLF